MILICFLAPHSNAEPVDTRQTEFHLDFEDEAAEPVWSAENDGVMGGVSTGGAVIRDGTLVFTGSLSLENNGGFAQVQIQDLGFDLSGKEGVKLRVMGDGRTYELRLEHFRFSLSHIDYA